jgi:hypothetical protein
MSIRLVAAAVGAAAAMVIATGGTAVAATSRAASPAVQITGAQLLSALLPQSDFPPGFKLDKSGVFDSGRQLEKSPARYNLYTMKCSSFPGDFGGTGFGETATAADDFADNAGTSLYLQQVYQFKTRSSAASFFNGLRALSHRCRAFLLDGVNGVVTRAFDARRIGGHPTFQVNQSGSGLGFLIALNTVFTVAGPDVFFTANAGVSVAPPSSPSARTSMLRLIKRVQAHW